MDGSEDIVAYAVHECSRSVNFLVIMPIAGRKILVKAVISADSILSSQVVEGSYCPVNNELVRDIYMNPHKYKPLFDNIANLKVLNYLEMCNRMDTTPYYSEFELIRYLDRESRLCILLNADRPQPACVLKRSGCGFRSSIS